MRPVDDIGAPYSWCLQQGEKVLRDSQKHEQYGQCAQRAGKTSDRHDHLGDDETTSDAAQPRDEQGDLSPKARACGRAEHRRAGEWVSKQPLHDDAAHCQGGAREKRRREAIATELEKRISKLRIAEVARADEHGKRSGDEQQQEQQRIEPHRASLPRTSMRIDARRRRLTVLWGSVIVGRSR